MKRALGSLLCCAMIAASCPAFADSKPAKPQLAQGNENARSARADALFRQGQALLEAGRYQAACEKFEASEAVENGLGTLLHLGDCYERAGRTASAWHAFLEAEAVAQLKKDSEREQIAAQRVAALEPKLTRVILVVPMTSRVPGLSVQLGANTIPRSAWGTIIPVDPGTQIVTANAKGHRAWRLALDTSRSGTRDYHVNVPTLEPEPQANTDRQSAYRTAGVVTGSVGLAGIGAGAIFSALARNQDDCTKTGAAAQCQPSQPKSSYSNVATTSFALGGALLATGITLFVLAPGPDKKETSATRIAARPARDGGRLQLEGVW